MCGAPHLSAAPSVLWRCILSATFSLRLLSDSASSSDERDSQALHVDTC